MNDQLVSIIDGVQTINFELLEEQYGNEVMEEIKSRYEYSLKQNRDFKFEVLEEDDYDIIFAFVTWAFTRVYEVSKSQKEIKNQFLLGYRKCTKLLDLMTDLEKQKRKGS